MKMVTLGPLKVDDKNQFIIDNHEVFLYGAAERKKGTKVGGQLKTS